MSSFARQWTLHLVNARNQLASCEAAIRSACEEAQDRLAAVTPPLPLDIVVSATRDMPEALFVSGHCYEPGVVGLRLDLGQSRSEEELRTGLLKTLFHEFHHALRWEGPGYGDTLGEALVSEGLAQRFLHEMMDCPPEPWEDAVSAEVCESYRRCALAAFDDDSYDHAERFFGAGEMPNLLGYTLGRWIVDRFMERHPNTTALRLKCAVASDFRSVLQLF